MYIQVKVIPKSAKTEFVERMDDETLKIRIKAAPERGKANLELIKFLAKSVSTSKEDIKIISGHTSTRKLIKVPDSSSFPW